MATGTDAGVDYTLKEESELRFEVQGNDAKVELTLTSGLAEIFGTELVQNKKYEFRNGAKVAVFTYYGCVLKVLGRTEVAYVCKSTPMYQYLNCHLALEDLRKEALKDGKRGPVVLIVGPVDVGKSTLTRILLNYAARMGRRPYYVDLDVSQGSASIPGTMSVMPVERPAPVGEHFSELPPLVYNFGHLSPGANKKLYMAIISKMADAILKTLDKSPRSKHSGVFIDTCGWVQDVGHEVLVHAAKAFEAGAIFVLEKERLQHELVRDMPVGVNVLLLPKSGGVVERSREWRNGARNICVKEYFYGSRPPLHPYSFDIQFKDLKLYKIGTPALPDSCMPLGVKAEDNPTKVVAITPSLELLHHILALSSVANEECDVVGSPVLGFICVTRVDMKRQTVTVLSPQPAPLPNRLLILSDILFMDSCV